MLSFDNRIKKLKNVLTDKKPLLNDREKNSSDLMKDLLNC